MSFAVLFSGQGTQHPAMLPWLDGGPLADRTASLLGVPDWRQALSDPEGASRNRTAQVLLTGIGLAAWQQIAPRLPAPAAVAGYSVGELAAFSAAGVFDADTALALALERTAAMDHAASISPGGLMAVSGLDAKASERLCDGTPAAVAIRMEDDAVVLGGPRDALAAIEARAVALGARCTVLKVSVPSHTPAMQPAAEAFDTVLGAHTVTAPVLPLVANATGDRVLDAAQARAALVRQIAHPVRWADCMDTLWARRVACVLEVGPGRALSALWQRRHPEVPARSVDDFRSAGAVVDWVLRQQD